MKEEIDLDTTLQRASLGEPAALDELYRAFSGRVFGLCLKMLGTPSAAEEATSEVFLRTQRSLDSYDPSRPFAAWILTIASNHCLNLLRRKKHEQQIFEDTAPVEIADTGAISPLGAVLANEQKRQLHRIIEQLPDKQRLPLVLRYYFDLSYDEIAEQLGISKNLVATLLFRAKKALRASMAQQQTQEEV